MAKKTLLLLALVLMNNVMFFAQSKTMSSVKKSYLPCPTGWTTYAGSPSCYKKPQLANSWYTARKACLADGGDLVTISSEQENNFVALLSQTYFPTIHNTLIGMIAEELTGKKQGKFHWVDGRPIGQYVNWIAGEPNNQNNAEYCGAIYVADKRPGLKWNDTPCVGTKSPYVCERERAKRVIAD
ncbi:perlucin-like protein [Exaiptasia diaphana]|uniref:C-type lectin domain-containing protein n=1 Tax=Exaiptasia diaphana TaxID=2652724 RepID=A0A913X195_EXADI|nr:perlucin-like protein [Exaiptasia diaphana]KXJ16201.1 Macrophage mannose receptor 1 [Exaiptasia diaphana]